MKELTELKNWWDNEFDSLSGINTNYASLLSTLNKIRENERLRIIEIEKEKVRMIENSRIYLKVSYDMKDIAKSFGAKWNPDNKKWFTSKSNMYNNNLFETFEVIKQY